MCRAEADYSTFAQRTQRNDTLCVGALHPYCTLYPRGVRSGAMLLSGPAIFSRVFRGTGHAFTSCEATMVNQLATLLMLLSLRRSFVCPKTDPATTHAAVAVAPDTCYVHMFKLQGCEVHPVEYNVRTTSTPGNESR